MLLSLICGCQRSDHDSTPEAQANACKLERENDQLRASIARLQYDCVMQLETTLNEKDASLWGCDETSATKVLKKRSLQGASLPGLIAAFNQRHAAKRRPLLQLKGVERDTAVITVDDPDLLTQRMGSTGAMCYLAGVTFTLTSLKGVDSVWFDFPEGEHASPGRYARARYINMIDVEKRCREFVIKGWLTDLSIKAF